MNASQSSKMYKVKRPDGQVWNIPEENVQKAISLGGRVVEVEDTPSTEKTSDNMSEKMFKVKRPDGQIWEVLEKNLDKAISLGGEVVQEQGKSENLPPKSKIAEEVHKFNEKENKKEITPRSAMQSVRDIGSAALDIPDFIASPVRMGLNAAMAPIGREIKPLSEGWIQAYDKSFGTANATPEEHTKSAIGRAVYSMPMGFGVGQAIQGTNYAKAVPKLVERTSKYARNKFVPETASKPVAALGNFLTQSNASTPANLLGTGIVSGTVQNALNTSPENSMSAIGQGAIAGASVPASLGMLSLLTKEGRKNLGRNTSSNIGKFLGVNPSKAEAFKNAGITPTLGDVTDSKLTKMSQNLAEKTPFVGSPIEDTRALQQQQIKEGLGINEDLTRTQGSKLTMKGAEEFHATNKAQHKQMFDKVESDIERLPDDTIGIKNIESFFEPIFKKFKKPSQEVRFKKSPVGKIYTELYEEAKANGGHLPYDTMKGYLDDINDLITTRGLIGDVSKKRAEAFAGALSKDIVDNLTPKFEKLGGDALENWQSAKSIYHEYATEKIPKLNQLFHKNKQEATSAFLDLIQNQKKGAEKTQIALEGLSNNEKHELINHVNHEFGRMPDGSFNPTKWVSNFKGLEPEARDILLSPLNKSNRKKLMAIAESVDSMKGTLNEANSSKSGYYVTLGALVSESLRSGHKLLQGEPYSAATLAGSLLLGRVASDKVLTNDKFINWMSRGMQAKNIDQFRKRIQTVPKIGEGTKNLQRQTQVFLHDLERAKNHEEKANNK